MGDRVHHYPFGSCDKTDWQKRAKNNFGSDPEYPLEGRAECGEVINGEACEAYCIFSHASFLAYKRDPLSRIYQDIYTFHGKCQREIQANSSKK